MINDVICLTWVCRYHTFCSLAGVDFRDAPPGLPDNSDSLDMWPMLSGASDSSPRKEMPIAIEGNGGGGHSNTGQWTANNITALIVGDYKVIFGHLISSAFWQGPEFPNASYVAWMTSLGSRWWTNSSMYCGAIDTPGSGCLFDIRNVSGSHIIFYFVRPLLDPYRPVTLCACLRSRSPHSPVSMLICTALLQDETEHVDLSQKMPAKLEELRARVKELRTTLFNPGELPFKLSALPLTSSLLICFLICFCFYGRSLRAL